MKLEKLENRNQEANYNAYSKKTTQREFTVQQPVARQAWYAYVQDLISINQKWGQMQEYASITIAINRPQVH